MRVTLYFTCMLLLLGLTATPIIWAQAPETESAGPLLTLDEANLLQQRASSQAEAQCQQALAAFWTARAEFERAIGEEWILWKAN